MNANLIRVATDPRDKIWSFLGISEDGLELTTVDLKLPVSQVYISFAQAFIRKYKSLRIIQSAGIGLRSNWQLEGVDIAQLPSWVPQWYCADPSNAPDVMVLDVNGTLFRAAQDKPANATSVTCGSILHAQGVLLTRLPM